MLLHLIALLLFAAGAVLAAVGRAWSVACIAAGLAVLQLPGVL